MGPPMDLEDHSLLFDSQSAIRPALLVSGAFALFFLAFLPPGIYSIDGNSMLAVAESLVTRHDFSVPAGLGSVGAGGHVYSNWYPLLSLIVLPLVALAHLVTHFVHLPFHYVAAVFALVIQVPLTATTAGLVTLLSLQLGATPRGAWLASIIFSFSTIAMVYARAFFAEPLLAFLIAFALFLAFRSTPNAIVGCASLTALAVLAKPPGVFIGPLMSAYLLGRGAAWWRAALPSMGSLCGFCLYAVYNQLRFGNPSQFGQPWIFRLASFPAGVAGLLFSPGWGLFWYCPALVLAVVAFRLALRSKPLEALTIAAVFLVFLGVHSLYENWSAGWAWGPRYLVPTIPGLCSLTSLLTGRMRKALMALSFAGLLVNAPTLFSFYERYLAELQESGIAQGADIAWWLGRSPALHGWSAAFRQVNDASQYDVRELFALRGEPAHRIRDSRALRVVAVWWWVLPIVGLPRWIGLVVSVALAVLGLVVLALSAPRNMTNRQ
jgi:hypothetical protein